MTAPPTVEVLRDRIKRYVVADDNGCWVWQRYRLAGGYASVRVRLGGQLFCTGHRLSYTVFRGPIPDGLHIDHLCRNRACVNPDHLEPVTPEENNRRGQTVSALNGLKTHCVNGHPFDEANTSIRSNGGRSCRSCWRENKRVARQKALAP